MDALTREDRLVPCQADCPAHIDVPAYIRAIREGRPGDAVAIIREKVPFPLVLGHICNHLCETECRRKNVSDPMGIRNLKRYAVEHDEAQAWKKKGYQLPDSGKRVAIVGSGPCGLTAAYYLRKKGHAVTVYERRPLPGGPMTSGIPAYRLPLEGVLDEIGVIEETGVKILTDTEIKDITPLRAENDAVLVAVELVLESGSLSAEHILNVVARLAATEPPPSVETHLSLKEAPVANTARYDRLRGQTEEIGHA